MNLNDANGRIERVASALPSVAAQVAQQDVGRQAKTVVVATKPVEAQPNKWASTILVYDLDKAAVTSYYVPLTGQFDRDAYTKATGAALATDRRALSFQDLEANLRSMQDTTQIAALIDA